MREILFRGIVKNKGFVYGQLEVTSKGPTGIQRFNEKGFHECYTVNPETVGQFTGLLDNNGTKIFEGDICKDTRSGNLVEVCWGKINIKKVDVYSGDIVDARMIGVYFHTIDGVKPGRATMLRSDAEEGCFEVIGNVHENPELSEVIP